MKNTPFFKLNNVEEHISDIIVNYLHNSCPFCHKNDALSFFDNHPNNPRTCYACKCSQVSMVTVRQGLNKLSDLKQFDHESIFNKLRKDQKSVKIREWQGYRENEYFSVPDLIQAMQNLSTSHNKSTTNKSRKRSLSKSDKEQGQPKRKRVRR